MSGKISAKNTEALSRRNPLTIATASARKAVVHGRSCAVLTAGEVEEDVLEGAGLHGDAVEGVVLGERGQHPRRRRGGDDERRPATR